MLTLIVTLLAAQQIPAAPTKPTPAPVRRPAAASANLEIRVTDRSGSPAEGVRVTADGPSTREGQSDNAGELTLKTLAFGSYRLRAEGDGFVTLEKEVAIRAGAIPPVEFSLSRAAQPPKPVEPPPPPARVVVESPPIKPGDPKVVSLLDVAEDSLGGKDPVRTVPVGCSGLSRAQLLVVRDSLPVAARPDADDMLYVIAGEASITLGGKTSPISSGFFTVVPRGTPRSITRRGKNPTILLSIVGGPPCSASSTE